MSYFLTIDGGTTNTRACLWLDKLVLAEASVPIGARDTAISGNRSKLEQAVRGVIDRTLAQAGIDASQLEIIIASGMLTSALGLHELPHCVAPAGLHELAQDMACVLLPQVFSIPIWFVPGVKNAPTSDPAMSGSIDMMRGEEVEVMGLIERLELHAPALIMLPGSHSKYISLGADGRITGCLSTLAGELLQTITQNTLLASSLESGFATEIRPQQLLEGATAARLNGFSRACFQVRIRQLFAGADREDCANFLLGAVFGEDLQALKHSQAIEMQPDLQLVIAGNAIMQNALSTLVAADDFFTGPVILVSASQATHLAGCGAIAIARQRHLAPFVSHLK